MTTNREQEMRRVERYASRLIRRVDALDLDTRKAKERAKGIKNPNEPKTPVGGTRVPACGCSRGVRTDLWVKAPGMAPEPIKWVSGTTWRTETFMPPTFTKAQWEGGVNSYVSPGGFLVQAVPLPVGDVYRQGPVVCIGGQSSRNEIPIVYELGCISNRWRLRIYTDVGCFARPTIGSRVPGRYDAWFDITDTTESQRLVYNLGQVVTTGFTCDPFSIAIPIIGRTGQPDWPFAVGQNFMVYE